MDEFQVRELKGKKAKMAPEYKLLEEIRELLASIADSNEAILSELKKLNESLKK